MIQVFGRSDDLIEIKGDIIGEIGAYGTDDDESGVLIIFSDGTLLEVKYGKNDEAIWEVKVIKIGSLFDRIEPCDNEDAKIYSDIAYFKDGIKWAYSAKEWGKVR